MPKALVGHATSGDFPEPQKRWGNAWPHREPQIYPKTFFWMIYGIEIYTDTIYIYICRYDIISFDNIVIFIIFVDIKQS